MTGNNSPSYYKLLKAVLFLSAIFALCIRNAAAHDFWILPHNSLSQQNNDVFFELRIGPGWPGKQTPRLAGLIATFDAWDNVGKMKVEGHDGALVIGHLKTRTPGTTIAALTTHGAKITLPADEFEEYLEDEGLHKISQQRHDNGESSQPGSELFFRCAKALIFVDNQSTGFDKVLGLERELVPLTEPLHYIPGTPFTVKLLSSSKPLQGIQIKAELNTSPPTVIRAVTDTDGLVKFILPTTGEWLFSAVDMETSPIDDADWKSVWASLTLPIAGDTQT
ncbi:TPA: DUF4198 domain-containing protein [Enterobacter hormaechei subsp. xiangfangensis]|nr:DUF4198 domain-containing protein [Enterobacter hormaechei subsp. xiangfangensis]